MEDGLYISLVVKVDLFFQPSSAFPFFSFLPLSLAILIKITCILEEALGMKLHILKWRDAKIKELWMDVIFFKKNIYL